MFLDIVKIFHHTHMVFCAVALIKSFQPFAWERRALKAKTHLSVFHQLTDITHM